MDIKSYTRSRIPPGINIPWGQVSLVYTNHARSRMVLDRSQGSLNILPNMILLSQKNLKQVWTIVEGKEEKLRSMLVEVPYTKGTLLQLVISADCVVITLYFRKVWPKTSVVSAELPQLESIVSDTKREAQLSELGQVVYPKGTYFPRSRRVS